MSEAMSGATSGATWYTCDDAFRRLDDYLDRELSDEEMRLVREHLETCDMCAQEFGFERSVLAQLRGKVQRIQAPPELLARIADSLARASGDGRG